MTSPTSRPNALDNQYLQERLYEYYTAARKAEDDKKTQDPIFYPPTSPDFPELKKKDDAPGSGGTENRVHWVDDVAPGSDYIPIPRSKPVPIPKLPSVSIAVEDQLPKPRLEPNVSSSSFTGYD